MTAKLLKILSISSIIFVTLTLLYVLVTSTFFNVEYEAKHIPVFILYYSLCLLIFFTYKIKYLNINISLVNILLLFNFCGIFISGFFELYLIIEPLDDIFHFISGFIVAILMLNILYSLSDKKHMQTYSKMIVFLFVVGCSISFAVTWEIFEFIADTILNTNMQASFFVDSSTNYAQFVNNSNRFVAPSLSDTMFDLIEGSVGAVLCTIFLLYYGTIKFYYKYIVNTPSL